jgi:Putative Flp pilus-assembly TadE/G-like
LSRSGPSRDGSSRIPHGDRGQTLGIYIVAVAALFFLAFAFFAVGQAASLRDSAQTAADAAALAAARHERDNLADPFLAALSGGNLDALRKLLDEPGGDGQGACDAAGAYAQDNDAAVTDCEPVSGPPGYTVRILTAKTVGDSVVQGTEDLPAKATATAVVEPRCAVGDKDDSGVTFTCDGEGDVTVDPTQDGFELNLAEFFSVHLSE